MNRIGYLVVAALVVALAGYAFWPEAVTDEIVHLHEGPIPDAFTVRIAGVDQIVDPKGVRIGGLARPVDLARVSTLWSTIDAVGAPKGKVVAKIGEADLAAYGIDGARAIDPVGGGGWRLRWGVSGGLGYCWDGHRVLCVPAAICERLDGAARRLDDQALLPGAIDRVTVGETRLERVGASWRDAARPDSPTLSVRASRLLSLIGALKLESLAPAAPAAGEPKPLLSFALHTTGPDGDHRLRLLPDGDAAVAVVDELPPQRLVAPVAAAWQLAVDDLGRDVLLDIDAETMRVDGEHLVAEMGGHPWFTVDRRQISYRAGETDWDVSWSGGREVAAEEQLVAVYRMLCDVAVERAATGPDLSPLSPLARRFRVAMQDGGVSELTIDGDRAWTPTHHGRLARATALAELQPAALLDLALLNAPPERVSKVQVQVHDLAPERAEVLARAEDGAWSRTYASSAAGAAKGPVDPVAVVRLARAFCAARAASARLLQDEDRAGLERPACEVALRLEPKSKGAPSMEITDERDTVPQDHGFAFYRDAAGAWRAVDVEGGVSYVVDEELVELARRPLDSDLAFPLVPGLVRRIEIARGATRYALARSGSEWTVELDLAKAGGAAADPNEVRRLMRALGELRVTARSPKAEPLLPAKAAAVVACVMPGVIGDERLTLTLAEPRGGSAEASVDSTSSATAVPPGRVAIPLGSLDEVAPQPARFSSGGAKTPAQ
jgi:hypothetical protein